MVRLIFKQNKTQEVPRLNFLQPNIMDKNIDDIYSHNL